MKPALVRVGFVGAAVVAGWWLWPKGPDAELLLSALAAVTHTPAAVISSDASTQMAGLRPTFTPTPDALGTPLLAVGAAKGLAAPMQIVIVTPTPGSQRTVLVAGAIIDRPLATAGNERTITLAGLVPAVDRQPLLAVVSSRAMQAATFDTSSIVVPPMVEEVIDAPIAQVEIIPIPGLTPKGTPAPTFTPAPTPTPLPELASPVRQWASFAPPLPEENDHFWVGQAFVDEGVNQIGAPSYQFGSTGGGRYRAHHGVDVANPSGTPVRAGVSGEVVHAGMDDPVLLGPYNNFYGNAVVIRLDQALSLNGANLDVYLLYGHLSQVTVQQGQRVQPGDVVGAVGMTGIAIGPHLHVEMRVGANDYQHSVNPYLWVKPLPGNGAVAARVLTADGRSWPGARLTLARFENGQAVWGRMIETYLDGENIGPDPAWGENGAMGDVPAGYYVLVGNINGESIRAEFFVREGQTTFVEVRTKE